MLHKNPVRPCFVAVTVALVALAVSPSAFADGWALQGVQTDGSWLGSGYDANFGPNYSTAMAVLALTVEYRYLPIYQRDEGEAKAE